jgi:hypothetical protein
VLSRLGQQVSQTAGGQLADGGNIGRAVNALGDRVRNIETGRRTSRLLLQPASRPSAPRPSASAASLNSGAAAYERIFST